MPIGVHMFIGESSEARDFRRRVADFLAIETEQASDRPVYLSLIAAGMALLYVLGGPAWTFAILPFYAAAELTYGRHARLVAATTEPTRRQYHSLRFHHGLCVACYVTLILTIAFTPGTTSAWAAGMLVFGQALNCIGHETRSIDATRFGIATVGLTALGAAIGVSTAGGFEPAAQAFAVLAAGLLAIYFAKVAMRMARTRASLTDRTDALRHAQKGEAVGRLTSGIAHDFNNLLTVMRGNIDLLTEVPEAERGPLLAEIGNATDRGGRLVGQLLASSRRNERREEVVKVGEFLATFSAFARRVLPSNVDLSCHAEGKLTVRCDVSLLDSALLNLVVNARDAMPDGGTIAIRAEPCDKPASAPRGAAKEGWTVLSVIDDGPGMPPDVLARATEPFMTTKPAGLGTGLGLAMVREFADRGGGSFVLESAVGRGTTARLRLPS